MIHVKRGRAPEVLTKSHRKGPKETARARAKYEQLKADPNKDPAADFTFTFSAYKDKEVKTALEKLFHGKCAYCETRYTGLQPVDVEHWRPKGLAIGRRGEEMKPGYYWLAAEWHNLLPSCIDCNRSRNHTVPPDGERINLGKLNQFPLADENKRWREHLVPDPGEQPLILDPCRDQPEEHLRFTAEGVAAAREVDPGQPSPIGEESIRVYALNRGGLVLERQEVLKLIQRRKLTILKLMEIQDRIERLAVADQQEREEVLLLVEELLEREMIELREFMRPEKPFSLMVTEVVEDFFAKIQEAG